MTKRRIYLIAVGTPLTLVLVAIALYVANFGTKLSSSQDIWAQFGDYFGGILNPLFAMFAFLALLWSISLQAREFHAASILLSQQAKAAQEQLDLLKRQQLREDLLHVIREISNGLDDFIALDVSAPGSQVRISVSLVLAEAQRIATEGGSSASYSAFLAYAMESGTVVEAHVRTANYLIKQMRIFLEQYSQFEGNSYSPMILYYANKSYRLLDLLETIGCLPADARQFFATITDKHG